MSGTTDQVLEPDLAVKPSPGTTDTATASGQEQDPIDLESLSDRVAALRRFLRVVDGHLPEPDLVTARTVVERAGERLNCSLQHTVVALAGATGSGKSSIFNALAGLPLSQVGVRRPTTSAAHACVWGSAGSGPLLDWLGVPPSLRFDRESALDGDELAALRGLVLLDLPDFDSMGASHRSEVDRLLRMADLIIWVLDPQKYADRVIHEQYLRRFSGYRDITLVVLNQVDTLKSDDAERCVADLRQLLDQDGLAGVPLLATSTVDPDGLAGLRPAMEFGVAAHEAFLWRLAGDLDQAVCQLGELCGPEATEELVDRAVVRRLVETMAEAAGVPAAVDRIERDYLHRAATATGWLVPRWLQRLRRDPLQRLGIGRTDHDSPESTGPEATAAQRAVASLAARELAELATDRLPRPWPAAAVAAALARQHDIPAAMVAGLAGTDLTVGGAPRWWRTVGVAQWISIIATAAGAGWGCAALAELLFQWPRLPDPRLGPLPLPALLLALGLGFGLLLSLTVQPLVRIAARAVRRRAERRLRSAIAEVASDLVVAPVRAVLRAYADARDTIARAR